MDSAQIGNAILWAVIGAGILLLAYAVIRVALADHDAAKERKERGGRL